MEKFAFISRHQPTPSQIELASKMGIELVPVGDRDGFKISPDEFVEGDFRGVVVVHAMAAMRCLKKGLAVGIFNNVNRAPEGAKPTFETTELVIERL